MAVTNDNNKDGTMVSADRRKLIGTNVVLSIVLMAAIVGVVQWVSAQSSARVDMTSSGINSLTPATERLIRQLDQKLTLTSLYFETDQEQEDQAKYRRAVTDLLDLYAGLNSAKVEAKWVNPLKDHVAYKDLLKSLRTLPKFEEQLAEYRSYIDRFRDEIAEAAQALIVADLNSTDSIGSGLGDQAAQSAVAPVNQLLKQLSQELEAARAQIVSYVEHEVPQEQLAVNELRALYRALKTSLTNISNYGQQLTAQRPDIPGDQIQFLEGASARYEGLITKVDAELAALQALAPLELEDIIAQVAETSNAVLLTTEQDALVLGFSDLWPPLDQGAGMRAGFAERAFKGEQKLTSAILRLLHKEQTAVIFARFGGPSLFNALPMMGRGPAPYARMREQLEDANFVVREWDLKTTTTPPTIDPPPTRTILVVMRPNPPEQNPRDRAAQMQFFDDKHREAVLAELEKDKRALFITGWGQGPMPSEYEYGDHLRDTWGIDVDPTTLVIHTSSTAPGQFVLSERFPLLTDVEVGDHPIVAGATASKVLLPLCIPMKLEAPEGVSLTPLITQPAKEEIWGIKSVTSYLNQRRGESVQRLEDATDGPFIVAAAGERTEAGTEENPADERKVVVVSSSQFAIDQVAFSQQLTLGAQGLTVRSRNPGNVTLLVNSLHWLNDNTEYMDIGRPLDADSLEASEDAVRIVRIFSIAVWPALALVGGMVAWFMRRR
jgi:uncharacterized membrane protein